MDVYRLDPRQLAVALKAAGYPGDQIVGFFDSLGGAFAKLVNELDPTRW